MHAMMHQELTPTARAGERQADTIAPPLATSPESEPALVPDAFDELVAEIGHEGACEVRAVFWTDTRARLKLLSDLALAEHRAKIGREAHSLKSAARTFGYCRLASLARLLETSADALSDDEYGRLLDAMEAAYAAALAQEPTR
jgi:HPt (histidine-containing phosphotransfer) domain-containing protein